MISWRVGPQLTGENAPISELGMSDDITSDARRRTEGQRVIQEDRSIGQLVCVGCFASNDPAKVSDEPFEACDFIRRDEPRVETVSK
jgi:hypothetical protein